MTQVFISYSRKDKEFVSSLHQALQSRELDTWVDWEDIPPTAVWLQEIFSAIQASDAFLFIISPDSLSSRICLQELEHAVQNNKRIVPVLHREVASTTAPPSLRQLNWVYLREADSLEHGFDVLREAIETDLDHVRTHTRLLVRAIEWESKGRDNSFLLRGSELREAEVWLADATSDKSPGPTSLHAQHIYASRRVEEMPRGTVTFLLTDIPDSTRLWECLPQVMQAFLDLYNTLLRQTAERHGGYIFHAGGEALHAAFSDADSALQAALDAQRLLSNKLQAGNNSIGNDSTESPPVRIALHTGAVEAHDGHYLGPTLSRAARLLSAAHGGQLLLSRATQELVRNHLPEGVILKDLGEHRLRDLTQPERIFQLVILDLPSQFPPLNTLDYRPNNLPRQSTVFIGREKEIQAVCSLLRHPDVSLVTLTGPGGTGKTRLALQAAAELLDDFADGVFSVELEALIDPSLVPSAIAQALGVTEAAGQPITDTLKDYLKDKQMLLVLDNFEHLIQAAGVADALLKAVPGLKVLATSRHSLHLYGEKEFPVPPFSLPDTHHLPLLERLTQYEAVRLFIERARDVRPDFAVTNDNAPAVAEICVRLDGLPLAIELAAARIKLFSPQALLHRLSSHVLSGGPEPAKEGRLKMLTGGAGNVPARQQTMRNTIEWSYELLDEGEKQLFRRMAVFQGGRTFEGLEAVCNADGELRISILEGVESLVSNNLLQQREGREGGNKEPRFWILETIHEYAREKLEESWEAEALKREHALYFMALAEEAEPQLTGAEQGEWLHTIEEEHDNLRAVMSWAESVSEKDKEQVNSQARAEAVEATETGLRIAGALWRFWYVRGYITEGRDHLSRALSSGAVLPETLARATNTQGTKIEAFLKAKAKALNGAGNLADIQGEYSTARSLHEESLALSRVLGDKGSVATSLNGLAILAYIQGEYSTARSLYEESLALRRELGDKGSIATSLNGLAIMAYTQGEYTSGRSLFEESLALKRELGDKWGIAGSLDNLGLVAYMQGEYSTARSLHEESLALKRELGDNGGIATSLYNLGLVAYMQGEYSTARSLYEESLALRRELGDKRGITVSLSSLGELAVGEGQAGLRAGVTEAAKGVAVEKGVRLLGASEALSETIGAVMEPEDLVPYERTMASARAQLGEDAFNRAREEGRAMSMEQAIEYTLEDNPPEE